MKKVLVMISLVFSLILVWPNNRILTGSVQSQINPVIDKVIAKLEKDQRATQSIEEYKLRKIYNCALRGSCDSTPKTIEKIRTTHNLDYIIEKDGRLIDPPEKLRFNTSALNGNALKRYDLVEIDQFNPQTLSYDFFPRIDQSKAISDTERVAELTIGKIVLDRNDFGIISMNSTLFQPIVFGKFLLFKSFQLFSLDVSIERERTYGDCYSTIRAIAYIEYRKAMVINRREIQEITLIRPNR